jgi:hypothetical protein
MTLKVSVGRISNATHSVTAYDANLVEETEYEWMYKSDYDANNSQTTEKAL